MLSINMPLKSCNLCSYNNTSDSLGWAIPVEIHTPLCEKLLLSCILTIGVFQLKSIHPYGRDCLTSCIITIGLFQLKSIPPPMT